MGRVGTGYISSTPTVKVGGKTYKGGYVGSKTIYKGKAMSTKDAYPNRASSYKTGSSGSRGSSGSSKSLKSSSKKENPYVDSYVDISKIQSEVNTVQSMANTQANNSRSLKTQKIFTAPFFSIGGQFQRIKNVGATLNAAFNPFSKRRVVAHVSNKSLKSGLESVSNHPYLTAGVAAAGITAARYAAPAIKAGAVKIGSAAKTGGSTALKTLGSGSLKAGKIIGVSALGYGAYKGITAASRNYEKAGLPGVISGSGTTDDYTKKQNLTRTNPEGTVTEYASFGDVLPPSVIDDNVIGGGSSYDMDGNLIPADFADTKDPSFGDQFSTAAQSSIIPLALIAGIIFLKKK